MVGSFIANLTPISMLSGAGRASLIKIARFEALFTHAHIPDLSSALYGNKGRTSASFDTFTLEYRPNETEHLTIDPDLQTKICEWPIRPLASAAGVSTRTVKAAREGKRLSSLQLKSWKARYALDFLLKRRALGALRYASRWMIPSENDETWRTTVEDRRQMNKGRCGRRPTTLIKSILAARSTVQMRCSNGIGPLGIVQPRQDWPEHVRDEDSDRVNAR
jgi:hypothetical protein